jgi:hypothetical protein
MAISIIKAPANISTGPGADYARVNLFFDEVFYIPTGSKFIINTDVRSTPIEIEVVAPNPILYTDIDYIYSIIKPLFDAALGTWYNIVLEPTGSTLVDMIITAKVPGVGYNINFSSVPDNLALFPGSNNTDFSAVNVLEVITVANNQIACLAFNPVEYILQTNNDLVTAGIKHKFKLQFIAFQNNGVTLTITALGQNIVFTFKQFGPFADNEIRSLIGGFPLSDWVEQYIYPAMLRNYVLDRNYNITFSGNEITFEAKEAGTRYAINATVPNVNIIKSTITVGVDEVKRDNFNLVFDVYAEKTYMAGDYELIWPSMGVPDAQKRVRFDISKALTRSIKPKFPPFATLVANGAFVANLPRRYYAKYAEAFGEPMQVKGYDFFAAQSLTLALFGGKKKLNIKDTDLTTNYINAAVPKLLTSMPNGIEVGPNQPQYLSVYWPLGVSGSYNVKARVKLYYQDGTSSEDLTAYTSAQTQKAIITFSAGYAQLGINGLKDSTKTVVAYDVWLADNGNVQRSQKFNFKVNHDYFRNNRYFIFINSFGCLETVWFTGNRKVQTQMDNDTYKRVHYNDTHESTAVYEGDTIEDNHETNYLFELSTGYKTKAYVDYVVEFFQSKMRYEFLTDKLALIVIDKTKVELYDDSDTDFGFKFSYQYSWKEEGLA